MLHLKASYRIVCEIINTEVLLCFVTYSVYRIIANYVVWRVVLEFLPDLPEVYQKVRREYRAKSQVGYFFVFYVDDEIGDGKVVEVN